MALFYFVIFLFEFFLIWVPSHYFISKELVNSFSLNILGLMTSLRAANPDCWSATLNLLPIDVEIILCDFSSRVDFYLGFGIDFCKDWLNRFEAHILFFVWTIHLRHFLSVKQISICSWDSDFKFLKASFYSLSPQDEKSVISLV